MTAFLLAVPRRSTQPELGQAERVLRSADASVVVQGRSAAQDGQRPDAQWVAGVTAACVHHDERLVVLVDGFPELVHRAKGAAAVSAAITAADIASRWNTDAMAMDGELTDAYALAVFDIAAQRLVLETDAFGLASLFYRVTDDAVLVSSEVAPLLAVGAPSALDLEALPDVFATRFLASSRTVWAGVRQVTQGTRLMIGTDGVVHTLHSRRFAYKGTPRSPSIDDAATRMRAAIHARFERMRDRGVHEVVVPVSGGVDSAILAGIAVQVFPVCHAVTFSIDDFPNPELERAHTVARILGMDLRVVRVTTADVARLHPWIIGRLQEPPLHYNNPALVRMLEEIRELSPHVISGDFGSLYGSGTLPMVQRQLARKARVDWIPGPVLALLASALDRSGQARLRRAARLLRLSVPELVQRSRALPISPAAARALPEIASHGVPTDEFVREVFDHDMPLGDAGQLWVTRFVTNPVVRRNARFASALGLRFHYPLVDVAALDVASSLPVEQRFDPVKGKGKPVLIKLCAELVGEEVANWPKIGFPTPELAWMEGPLLDRLTASLADDAPLAKYMDVAALRALPRGPNQQTLWTVMTLDEVLRQGAAVMAEQQPA